MIPKYPHIRLEPEKCKYKDCMEELLDDDGYCEKHQNKKRDESE